jgi:hypothetical protein
MKPEDLSDGGMWKTWCEVVRDALPYFAANAIYVEQGNPAEERFCRAAEQVDKLTCFMADPCGKSRDEEFGARMVDTPALGRVNRMWLEANIEIDFLRRHLPMELSYADILEIGAGYGRLAVMLAPLTHTMTCVDAIPISTKLCRYYCQRFYPPVKVLTLDEFITDSATMRPHVAINIHSWNECSPAQVQNWIDVIVSMGTPFLFTVSHGTMGSAYALWNEKFPVSFRPMIEQHFNLIAEEPLGLSDCPHALWVRK